MDLNIVFKITAIVAMASMIVLAFYAIVSLKSITSAMKHTAQEFEAFRKDLSKKAELMQNDLTDIKNSLIASSEHFNSSADEIKLTAIKFRDTSERFDVSIDRLGNIFSPIELLVKDVYLKIAPPIKSATGFVSAASKAVSVFSDVLLRKKK